MLFEVSLKSVQIMVLHNYV